MMMMMMMRTNGGAIDRLNAAKRVVGHIRSADALKREDLLLLEQLLRSAEKDGLQASKAKFWSIATVRRLIFATGRILATGAVGGLAANYADSSQLFERLTKLMLQGEAAVTDFIQDLPSASREALLAVIESLKDAG